MATKNYSIKIALNAVNNTKKALGQATKDLEGFVEKNKSSIEGIRNTATVGFGLLAGAVGYASKQASDLEESMNAVNVVFREGADVLHEFGKTASTSVGLAQSEFNQMSANTGALIQDLGLPMDEVSKLTIELTKRSADLASVYNTDVSLAMSAIGQAIRGETEAIRAFNGDVTDASIQQFALSQGINKSVTEMTQQEKKLLRLQLLMQQTSVVAGDFQNTQEGSANQVRILQAQIRDTSATLGQQFLPAISQILQVVNKLIGSLSSRIKENPILARNIVLVTGAVLGLISVLGTVALSIGALSVALGVITGPIGLTVLAIGALTTAGVLLYKNRSRILQAIKKVFAGEFGIIAKIVANHARVIVGVMSLGMSEIGLVVYKNWESIKATTAGAVDWMGRQLNNLLSALGLAEARVAKVGNLATAQKKGTGGNIDQSQFGPLAPKKLFETQKAVNSFDFSNLMSGIEEIGKLSTGGGGGGIGAMNVAIEETIDIGSQLETIMNEIKTQGENAFNDIGSSISESGNKLLDYKRQVQGLEGEIENLNKKSQQIGQETDKELATRAVELQKQIQEIQSGGQLDQSGIDDIRSKQKELELIQANTTAEAIKQAEAYSKMSETEKILANEAKKLQEVEEERAKLQTQIADIKTKAQAEIDSLREIYAVKDKLEATFRSKYGIGINTGAVTQAEQGLRDEAQSLTTGGPTATRTPGEAQQLANQGVTVNISGINATIREEADINRIAEQLARKINLNRRGA